jgi:geranylgeranyl diphosphate synthase type II
MAFDLEAYFAERRRAVDEALDRYLPPATAVPTVIHEAMRYSVFAGGKRLRPILVIAGAEAVGGQMDDVMPTACCFELIHTYSLVHDHLPAMGDDDYRRGRLTNHKVFGEAMAVLAGDALLTHALGLVAVNFGLGKAAPDAFPRVLAEITGAAGTDGMVGGQVVDVQSEGQAVSAETLEYIHTRKTAALIRGALRSGALLAGASEPQLAALTEYGDRIGLTFQIVDDILDVEGSLETWEEAGKDERLQKATIRAAWPLASKARAAALTRRRTPSSRRSVPPERCARWPSSWGEGLSMAEIATSTPARSSIPAGTRPSRSRTISTAAPRAARRCRRARRPAAPRPSSSATTTAGDLAERACCRPRATWSASSPPRSRGWTRASRP